MPSPSADTRSLIAEDVVVADRFRLIRPIGKGGMGAVWEATHLALDIPCAVKFIDGNLQDRETALHRFEREAKTVAQIRGRHVVQVLDHGVWEGVPYMAMELLHGESLRARLARVKVLSPSEVRRIVRHVCRGLRKAHERGIVHRDLKPDNIFLTVDDDLTQGNRGEIAKVLDFGVAKWTTQEQILASHTRSGDLLGTPVYMSPEQIRGMREIDTRSDLWSLAVIVFRCLTGRLPFVAESFGNLVLEICTKPLVVPSEIAAVPPGFDAWWKKAAAREPYLRFQTEREFFDSLVQVLGDAEASGASQAVSAPSAPSYPQIHEGPIGDGYARDEVVTRREGGALGAETVRGMSLSARERRHARSRIVGAAVAAGALLASAWLLFAPRVRKDEAPMRESAAPSSLPAETAEARSAEPRPVEPRLPAEALPAEPPEPLPTLVAPKVSPPPPPPAAPVASASAAPEGGPAPWPGPRKVTRPKSNSAAPSAADRTGL